jgi:hypothetical protein
VGLLAAVLVLLPAAPAGAAIGWKATGTMSTPREDLTLTPLPDGRVLAAGGKTRTAEIYSPASGTWSAAPDMSDVRTRHTATTLIDGRVLVAGGADEGFDPSDSAEIFDPSTNAWNSTGSMAGERQGHTATRLANGKVLVVAGFGGTIQAGVTLGSAELYDPATGAWSSGGLLTLGRSGHSAALLPSGKVLIAGGVAPDGTPQATTEIYDPAGNSWAAGPSMAAQRSKHTATRLPDGRVLVAGSANVPTHTTELFSEAGNAWTAAPAMGLERGGHTATELPGGDVLVAGGTPGGPGFVPPSSQRFSPQAGTWSGSSGPFDMLTSERNRHAAVPLPDGDVLVAGGNDRGSVNSLATAERYPEEVPDATPPPGPPPAGGPPINFPPPPTFPIDRTAPTMKVAKKATQKVGRTVNVTLTCDPNEVCMVSATGTLSVPRAGVYKLKPAKRTLRPGQKVTLKLALTGGARQDAAAALKRRRKVRATVVVVATDVSGNTRRLKQVVTLKR